MEYLNPAFERVYGQSREEILGEGPGEWGELIHPDGLRTRADRAGVALPAGAATIYELTPDGVRCTITLPVSTTRRGTHHF